MASREGAYEFGDVRVDTVSGLVSRSGMPVLLEPKAYELLVYFIQHRGRLLVKQEILDGVWGETFVSENALSRVVAQLRKALGDDAHESRYIETVPRRGYRFIADVDAEPRTERNSSSRRWAIPAVLVGSAVLAAALARGPFDREEDVTRPQTRPFTSFEGHEIHPAFSPDGRQIAYGSNAGDDGVGHIYVQLVGGGEPLQLTHADNDDANPVWSPDGSEIAFLRQVGALAVPSVPSFEVLAVPALGGSPRVLGPPAAHSRPAWHPDGEHVVIGDPSLPAKGLQLLSLRTGEVRPFTFPPEDTVIWDRDPAFSPDGETMAFVRDVVSTLDGGELLVMPSAGGEPRKVTLGNRQIRGFDWTPDGKALVFASPRHAGRKTELWKIPVAGGEPVLIEGTEGAVNPTVARNRLAYSREVRDLNVWRVAGPNALEPTAPEKFIASTRDELLAEYSPDGAEIALVSDRDGELAIWITRADGKEARKLVGGTRHTGVSRFTWAGPRWSPTGDEIAYGGWDSENNLDVFTVNVRGDPPRNVTASEFIDARPSWSPDGRWIYFQSLRHGMWEIWRVPSEGGKAVQITRGGGIAPIALQNHLYYWMWNVWQIRRTEPEGGEGNVVVDRRTNKWTVWKGKIVYIAERETGTVIELFDPESGTTREIASLSERPRLWFGLSVSPDGKWILYTQNDNPGSDIMLVENFR